ncbi:hypothetical protein FHS40_008331 [Streptomyces spectabilis]|uniref:Uncharacterized protein n=1 Tax=Streptomyces spectabilis TaxID=68270 RepID=A0A7W8B2N3_STRST|nr:hypothetical protein [Streptomyces spectabilis]
MPPRRSPARPNKRQILIHPATLGQASWRKRLSDPERSRFSRQVTKDLRVRSTPRDEGPHA